MLDSYIRRHRSVATEHTPASQQDTPIRQPLQPVLTTFTDTSHKTHYDKWNKFDTEQALQQIDDDTNHTKKKLSATEFLSERITELKTKGNEQFKKKQFDEAIDLYTMALRLGISRKNELERTEWNNLMSQCYGNRAMANLKLNKLDSVVQDCDDAIKIDANYTKAWVRRATAYKALKKYEKAFSDFENALKSFPDGESDEKRMILKEIDSIKKKLPLPFDAKHSKVESSEDMKSVKQEEKVSKPIVEEGKTIQISHRDDSQAKEVLQKVEPTSSSLQTSKEGSQSKSSREDREQDSQSQSSPTEIEKDLPSKSVDEAPKRERVLLKKNISTAYEFENTFREVSGNPDLVLQLISRVNSSNLRKLAMTVLDEEFMITIMRALKQSETTWLEDVFECKSVLDGLLGLSSVRRFGMVVSFLDSSVKQEFKDMLMLAESRYPEYGAEIGRLMISYKL